MLFPLYGRGLVTKYQWLSMPGDESAVYRQYFGRVYGFPHCPFPSAAFLCSWTNWLWGSYGDPYQNPLLTRTANCQSKAWYFHVPVMCEHVPTNQNTAGKSNFSSTSLEKCPFKEILFIILFFFFGSNLVDNTAADNPAAILWMI